jgi:ATP-dependent Clp protease ATP-binding subunit ClpC
MYEKFSKRVDQVMRLAQQYAREYEQDFVGTEHLLLAIAKEGTGLGAQALTRRGISLDDIRHQVDKLIKASLEDTWVFGRLPGSPHVKNVVTHAIEEARALSSNEVCTEHLLLGLLREKGSTAHSALKQLGVDARGIRNELRETQA